jgi:hypothetical protein
MYARFAIALNVKIRGRLSTSHAGFGPAALEATNGMAET